MPTLASPTPTEQTAARPDPPSETVALLFAFVRSRDEPCPVCGYSLRGLAKPLCPECAAPLELRVGSPQLRVGPWALAMVGFALALGFDGVIGLIITARVLTLGAPTWQLYSLSGTFVFLTLAMLAAMIALVRRRHAWMRRARRRQWALAAALFAGVGALHALVGCCLVLLLS